MFGQFGTLKLTLEVTTKHWQCIIIDTVVKNASFCWWEILISVPLLSNAFSNYLTYPPIKYLLMMQFVWWHYSSSLRIIQQLLHIQIIAPCLHWKQFPPVSQTAFTNSAELLLSLTSVSVLNRCLLQGPVLLLYSDPLCGECNSIQP